MFPTKFEARPGKNLGGLFSLKRKSSGGGRWPHKESLLLNNNPSCATVLAQRLQAPFFLLPQFKNLRRPL